MFYIGESSVYFRLMCPLFITPFPYISEESCMETSIGYASTIIPKVLYPVNGESDIKWLENCDRWGVIWARAAMNRFVKRLRGCFAMEEEFGQQL